MSAMKSEILWTRRKMLARVVLGSAAGVALTACGGGSDGGDSTAEKQQSLKDAFNRLQQGMMWTDVESLVGFQANVTREPDSLVWRVGDIELNVAWTTTEPYVLLEAGFKEGDSPARVRKFT
jgi:hypothetical protein